MLKNLGRLIWRQPREISVLNYPNHMVYEIYTNSGFQYLVQDKTTEKIECVKKILFNDRDEGLPCLWPGERGQTILSDKRLS